jgi:hypothetical protein
MSPNIRIQSVGIKWEIEFSCIIFVNTYKKDMMPYNIGLENNINCLSLLILVFTAHFKGH